MFYVTNHLLTDADTSLTSFPQGQAQEPYAGVGGAAASQGGTAEQVAEQDMALYNAGCAY
jgi:hypothetical protein